MLDLHDDATFYYDADAAEKPIRFIEKFCRHYEGRFAGDPFLLLEWQKQLVRTLFGWLRRADGLRRFRELFLLTSKGAGKTPLLSAIGLYMLLGDGEAAPHVISMASSFEQANLTFENAKRYIGANSQLQKHCDPKQYQIKVPKTHGKWTLISGKPTGRSGSRPNCCIADEAHEWEAATAKTYALITANLFKRSQPLLLVATNAPSSRTTFAYQLYERAKKVLAGQSKETTLLPVIYEAAEDAEWTTEAAARAANPSIPDIITFDQLQPALIKAMQSPEDEQEYRRLYLSQQVQSAAKWLDLKLWDSCIQEIDPSTIKDAPCFVGLDLSQGDDLCAATFVWATAERFYVNSRFWLPKVTAEKYEKSHAIPYTQWADAKAITLFDEPTVSVSAKRKIADEIIAQHKIQKIKAVCYDRYKADDTIAALEAAGIVCLPIGQGWGVARGCEELDRRLKEQSITIAPNPVLRACAETVETKSDDRGNYWPIKPNAKGRFAGQRHQKIDGISALVTALTEARRATFAKPASNVGAFILNNKGIKPPATNKNRLQNIGVK